VPGAIAALAELAELGRLGLERDLQAAIAYADEGFPVSDVLAAGIAEESERLAQDGGGGVGVASREQSPPFGRELFEPGDIEVVLAKVDQIGPAAGDENTWPQRLAELRHVDLDRLDGVRRRLAAPELLREPLDVHWSAAVDQKERQQRTLLRRCDLDAADLSLDLELAEQPESHRPTFAQAIGSHNGLADALPALAEPLPEDAIVSTARP
jgi:hypothetical protein